MDYDITLVYGRDIGVLGNELPDQMYRARRTQFKEVLGWDLQIDDEGREMDAYDKKNPLYIILRDKDGSHAGSTRLMPTTGPTMIADHFSDLTDGVAIASPAIWECTRFFVTGQSARSRAAAASLMWAGCQFGLRAGVQFYVGVTAAQMVRVFQACGWPAEVIGRKGTAEGEICACLWEISPELCGELAQRAGVPAGWELRVYRPPLNARNSERVAATGIRELEPARTEAF